jgi:hypothetical protein
MEVDYTLTLKDFDASVRHHCAHRQTTTRHLVAWWVTSVGLGVLLGYTALASDILVKGAGLFIVGACLGVAFAPLLARLVKGAASARGQLKDPRNQGWRGPWRTSIGPEGLSGTAAHERTVYAWYGIRWIDATADHVFLYTTPYLCVIVPRRAFRDDRHFEEFIDLARRYRDEARAAGESHAPRPPSDAITRDIS